MHAAALKGSRRGFNRPRKYTDAVQKLQRHGISVNGCFVLGMDHDTPRTLRLLPFWVDYLGLNLARFALLTPVPGSELYRDYERQGRILTRDWSQYTQSKVVFRPQHMSPERLAYLYEQVWKRSYTWGAVLRRVKRVQVSTPLEKAIVFFCNVGFKFLGKDM